LACRDLTCQRDGILLVKRDEILLVRRNGILLYQSNAILLVKRDVLLLVKRDVLLLVERVVLLNNLGPGSQVSVNDGALLSPVLQKVAAAVVIVGHVVLYLSASQV